MKKRDFCFFKQKKSLIDFSRSIGVENLSLSQLATSYTTCKQNPINFLTLGVTEEKKNSVDHLTKEYLPKYIKLSFNRTYSLRRFLKVLRIQLSTRKKRKVFCRGAILVSLAPRGLTELEKIFVMPDKILELVKTYSKTGLKNFFIFN